MMQFFKFLPVLIFLFSCEKIFQENEDQYIELESYQDKVEIINGIYSQLVDVHDKYYFYLNIRSDDVKYNYQVAEKDRVTGKPNYSYGHDIIDIPDVKPQYPEVIGTVYRSLYRAILGANSVIAKSSGKKEEILLGEAHLLRAYCHFKLARFFGTPPIVDDIDVDYHLPKPTYKEVYEFIENDLLKAIKWLPDRPGKARIPGETPHEGTAKALLAEVYLSMAGYPVSDGSKYAEAARLAGEVINEAEGYGYRLLDDFADLWDSQNKYNSEDIFALHFMPGGNSRLNEIGYNFVSYHINLDIYRYLHVNSLIQPDFLFYAKFPLNYRKQITLVTGSYYKEQLLTSDSVVYVTNFKLFDPITYPATYVDKVFILKWIDWELIEKEVNKEGYYLGFVSTEKTLYLLRYAQTLLTFAEAKARIGELDQNAMEALNMVRRRSYNVDIYSPSIYDINLGISQEEFIDTVLDERSFEFFFEPDGRWFDIIRLDLKEDLGLSRNPRKKIPDALLTQEWYFYKIPQEDRWINENLE